MLIFETRCHKIRRRRQFVAADLLYRGDGLLIYVTVADKLVCHLRGAANIFVRRADGYGILHCAAARARRRAAGVYMIDRSFGNGVSVVADLVLDVPVSLANAIGQNGAAILQMNGFGRGRQQAGRDQQE